jgi:hypothetical protein
VKRYALAELSKIFEEIAGKGFWASPGLVSRSCKTTGAPSGPRMVTYLKYSEAKIAAEPAEERYWTVLKQVPLMNAVGGAQYNHQHSRPVPERP